MDSSLPLPLAVLGLVLLLWSRVRVAREARALSKKARLLVRLVPFSEFVCFAGDWNLVHIAAFSTLLGAVLVLPWMLKTFAGETLRTVQLSAAPALLAGRKVAIDEETRSRFKLAKVNVLRERAVAWHGGLQSRRGGLGGASTTVVEEFNGEASAYHLFLSVAREEAAAVTQWIEPEPAASPAPEVKTPPALASARPEPAFKPLSTFKPLPTLKALPSLDRATGAVSASLQSSR